MEFVQVAHPPYRVAAINGRYLPPERIEEVLQERFAGYLKTDFTGKSVEDRTIPLVEIGTGPVRILMWSQMHGNESTTTKAVIDLLSFLRTEHELATELKQHLCIQLLPMLNPDGALRYTRVNARGADLNRDAVALSQPESRVLREQFEQFDPHFCFNLHDQRTLFSAGKTGNPATLSFLAPAAEEQRLVTSSRKVSMGLIAGMNACLQNLIPGRVGRYDDRFNPNCVGDSFQAAGVPTVLFEAGHSPGDYLRETTRELIWHALLAALQLIRADRLTSYTVSDYEAIPENEKLFFDVLIKHACQLNAKFSPGEAVGIRYKEELVGEQVRFQPEIVEQGALAGYFGHLTLDCADPEALNAVKQNRELLRLFE